MKISAYDSVTIMFSSPNAIQYALHICATPEFPPVSKIVVVGGESAYRFLRQHREKMGDTVVKFVKNFPGGFPRLRMNPRRTYAALIAMSAGLAEARALTQSDALIYLSDLCAYPVAVAVSNAKRLSGAGVFLIPTAYGNAVPVAPAAKDHFYLALLRFVYKARMHRVRVGSEIRTRVFVDSSGLGVNKINCTPSPEIYRKFQHSLEVKDQGRHLLFYDSAGYSKIYENYADRAREICRLLHDNGFHIHVKGHPRQGRCAFWDKLPVNFYPDYVPGEFVDLTQFAGVCSPYSVALVAATHYCQKVVCLERMFSRFPPDESEADIQRLTVDSRLNRKVGIKMPGDISRLLDVLQTGT